MFPKGLEEELFGWAASPLAFPGLHCAGFATWLSWQQLNKEPKQGKGLGVAKLCWGWGEVFSPAQGAQELAVNHPLALRVLSFR